ncbi:putative GPI anchored protein [Talaromyces proteolyticus]|uniref:GPI anchored protein n=1 Tax=Talaromyces proteolyticus TaxID=1131652 RepID=A0AAD4KLI1_9EURO|nr:putative GPI anchored protein [Talaromyces proteolyticus]KAH8691986.1 putative GPI anchored protein [Talaromyces proteolyticus]
MGFGSISSLALFGAILTSGHPMLSAQTIEPPCRFALQYTQEQVLNDTSTFINDLLYWEGKFHQNNVSYNNANGMSYDGTNIDWTTGERTVKHPFSAASKESLQVMLYTHAVAGSPEAARFLSPKNPSAAPEIATSIMKTKLETYLRFNETYPGFGGFLPWFVSDAQDLSPTWDWVNRVPGLDNGELLWAVYGFIQSLENTENKSYQQLASDWQIWMDYTKTTAAKIFYKGNGKVCAVTDIKNQSLPVNDAKQTYTCEGTGTLNDPYEGELFTFWLQLFAGLSEDDKSALSEVKKPQLMSVDYHMGKLGPITVQKGYWFSSHETWKVMEMPYYDIDIIRRVYQNAERVRTCNSVSTKVPGMFASVNNSTDPETGDVIGYISNAGIPSISNQTVQELDVITPYSVFPTILFNKSVGLAWWRNMAIAKKMQNMYGSTESTRVDGTLISALVTWDSKITTVIAILGGVTDFVRQKMKADNIYDEFINTAQDAYSSVFNNLKGENIDFCLPEETVNDSILTDFTLCN